MSYLCQKCQNKLGVTVFVSDIKRVENYPDFNVAEKIVDLGNMIATNSLNTSVTISAITQRSDEESLERKVEDCNKVLKKFCNQNGWGFVAHLNIDETCLNNYKLHLNKKGVAILASNFVNNVVN